MSAIKKYYTLIGLFFSLLIMFSFFGCATTPVRLTPLPGDPVAKFPRMVVGDTWIYTGYSQKHGIDTYTTKVTYVEQDGGFTVERKGKKNKKIKTYNYDNKGIQINPPYKARLLNFPLFVGKKWSDKYRTKSIGGNYCNYKNDYIVKNYKTVSTRAGSFQAFKIFQRQYNKDLGWRGTNAYWYAPEVKRIVKSNPSWMTGKELISYELATAKKPKAATDVSLKHKKPDEKPKIVIKGEKVKIGILEFQSLNEEAKKDSLGKIISEILTTSFVNSQSFKIIEREQLQKVLKEFNLSQSGIIDTSYAKKIGKITGADAIITGSVIKIGSSLRLDARIIDVESGIILTAEKCTGKLDIESIGIMAEQIVASLANKFYEKR